MKTVENFAKETIKARAIDVKIAWDTIIHVVGFVADFFFFHSGERIKKYPNSLPNSPDACRRKPHREIKKYRVDGAGSSQAKKVRKEKAKRACPQNSE